MTEIVQPPYAGQPLRASWAVAVSDGVNRLGVMGPSRMLVREFAGGCGFEPLPANNRWRVGGVGLAPFAARYVKESDADTSIPYTGWEIYLPAGCVAVGSTCTPMNPKAYRLDANGERKDEVGWYRMPDPGDHTTGDDWLIVVHAKCCAALSGIDAFQDWPRRYLWAAVEEVPGDMTQEEREENVNNVGDTFADTVGTIVWKENDDGDEYAAYTHTVKTPIFLRDEFTPRQFALYTAFEVDEDDLTLSLDRLFVRNLVFNAAGASFVADGMTEIETDAEAVYLKISALTTPYTGEVKSYSSITNPDGETMTVPEQVQADRQDGEIWLQLYGLKNGHVVTDGHDAIRNIQLYQ